MKRWVLLEKPRFKLSWENIRDIRLTYRLHRGDHEKALPEIYRFSKINNTEECSACYACCVNYKPKVCLTFENVDKMLKLEEKRMSQSVSQILHKNECMTLPS